MVLVPMPSIFAPSATRKCARSWTCGSEAALRRYVVPWAATAATSAFSVAVTLGSSRNTSAPLSLLARNSSRWVAVTVAPNCSKARKCVSRRRRPMTSPPGGGSATSPQRASSGPASRLEARIRAQSSGARSAARTSLAWNASVLRSVQFAEAFAARQRHALAACVGRRLEQADRSVNCGLRVLAAQQAGIRISLLKSRGIVVELACVGRAEQGVVDDGNVLDAADGALEEEALAFGEAPGPAALDFIGQLVEALGDVVGGRIGDGDVAGDLRAQHTRDRRRVDYLAV